MYNSTLTLEERIKVDREIEEMKKYPLDYSDIPPPKPGRKVRWGNQEFLDKLPRDIVRELALRKLAELRAAGHDLPQNLTDILDKAQRSNERTQSSLAV
jgi:hypothetical protein